MPTTAINDEMHQSIVWSPIDAGLPLILACRCLKCASGSLSGRCYCRAGMFLEQTGRPGLQETACEPSPFPLVIWSCQQRVLGADAIAYSSYYYIISFSSCQLSAGGWHAHRPNSAVVR